MPSISSCPECHRDLTLPDVSDRGQTLRCPLCDAQFPAERVMADSVSFPPAAIVVPTGDTASPTAEHPVESKPWSTTSLHDTGTGEGAERPSTYESDLEESDLEESDLEESDHDGSARDRAEPDPSDPGESHLETADENPYTSPATSADGSQASTDYASFGQQAATMRTAPRTKRQTSPLGALGQFVGMALGGVLGLALGYLVLLWLGGPQADFLHLRAKMPRWLLPSRRHNDAGQNLPVTSRESSRSGQPRRSLADVLQDGETDVKNDVPSAEDTGLRVTEPSTPDRGPRLDEPAATEARPSSPAEVPPGERLPPGSHAFPEDYLGPRAFKSRTVSELTAALGRADRALRCPHCQAPSAAKLAAFTAPATDARPPEELLNSRRCDYCRGKPLPNLPAAAFDRLCDLAEIITFVQFEENDPHRDECREAAEGIALALGSHRDRIEIAGRLAGGRLDESQRQSNGILLAGTIQRAESEGELFAIQLMLFGCGKPVTVISRGPPEPPVARRDRLVVLGSIVDSPRDNLAGYAGNLPQVVWGGLPLKLASAAR